MIVVLLILEIARELGTKYENEGRFASTRPHAAIYHLVAMTCETSLTSSLKNLTSFLEKTDKVGLGEA